MTDDQSTHDRALTEPGPDAGQGSGGAPPDDQDPGAGHARAGAQRGRRHAA